MSYYSLGSYLEGLPRHRAVDFPLPQYKRVGGYFGGAATEIMGFLAGAMVSIGTPTPQYDATDGHFMRWTSGASTGNRAGFRFNALSAAVMRKHEAYMEVKFRLNTTGVTRLFIGLAGQSGSDLTGEDPLNGIEGIMAGKRSGDTNWQAMYNDGTGATNFKSSATTGTHANVQSNTAVSTGIWTVAIAAAADSGWSVWINGKQLTRNNEIESEIATTDHPGSTDVLYPHIYCETNEAVAKTLDIFYALVACRI